MNVICHCNDCGYCVQERCANPLKVVNSLGVCNFRYDSQGRPRRNQEIGQKETITIIDVEPIKENTDEVHVDEESAEKNDQVGQEV